MAEAPLTMIQERFAALYERHPACRLDHMTAAFELHGTIDVKAFQRALARLMTRHELLRAGLAKRKEARVFVFEDEPPDPLRCVDIAAGPGEDAALGELVAAQHRQPFDVSRPPLLRVCLLRRADDRAVLIVTVHHLIADDWSVKVMIRELAQIYVADLRGETPHLPTQALSQADIVARERALVSGPEGQARLRWWSESYLRGHPSLVLAPESGDDGLGSVAVSLPASLMSRVAAFADSRRVRVATVLLAGYARTLAHLTGQPDILVKQVVLNRTLMGDQFVVGDLIDFVLLRIAAPKEPTSELVRRADEHLRLVRRHRLPYWYLIRETCPERYLQRAGVGGDELNIFTPVEDVWLTGAELRVRPLPELAPLIPWSPFDRSLVVQPRETGGWTVRLLFNQAVASAASAEQLVTALQAWLADASERAE